MVSSKIYVEGGGDSHTLRTKCRKGFSEFFKRAGLVGRMPRIVACGSRNKAYGDFCIAVKSSQNDKIPVLLVDSEGPVNQGIETWQYLKERDSWECPPGATEDQAHLMVQCTESWFLADKATLQDFYGHRFNANALPARNDIENVPKNDLFNGLQNATRPTLPKGEYDKGKHAFELLAMIDPSKVRQASPHADALLRTLER